LRVLKARCAVPFRNALREAVDALDVRARLVLKQHYLDGLSTEELGALHGVHRVTALRWLVDARERVATLVERRLQSELKVSAAELESLVRSLRSQIDISLGDLFSSHDGA